MSGNQKGDLPSVDSGAPSLEVSATADVLHHHEEIPALDERSANGGTSSTVRPFNQLSGNVFSYENGARLQSKDVNPQEMVLEPAKPMSGTPGNPVVFNVGDGSEELKEGSTTTIVPHQEQESGESEVLKNLRRAEAAYVSEMKYKDSRIFTLETQLVQAGEKEEELTKQLEDMTQKKNITEGELRKTKAEYARVVREKDQVISRLKGQIEEKERTIEECKSKISVKELENQKMKDEHEGEIETLKQQLDKTTKKYNEEVRSLLDQKHDLELKVKDLQISESTLKAELESARCKAAEYRATLAEERLNKKSVECSAKDEEIKQLRSNSDAKDEEIRRLQHLISVSSLSSGASLSSQSSMDNSVKRATSD